MVASDHRFKIVFTIGVLLLGAAAAQSGKALERCAHDTTALRCVQFVSNYDGDTIKVNIADIHPIIGNNMSVRLLGIDTPEIRSTNNCERDKAKLAKKLVGDTLKTAVHIDITSISRGKYFRIVGKVIADGQDVSKLLIEHGQAVEYLGKTKPQVDWCKPLPNSLSH